VFLELDQMPPQATTRPHYPGELPQGAAIGSFLHPNFAALVERNQDLWITPPRERESAIYGGKRAGTLRALDGTLVELIEM
jgi:hypothetical protein